MLNRKLRDKCEASAHWRLSSPGSLNYFRLHPQVEALVAKTASAAVSTRAVVCHVRRLERLPLRFSLF